MTISVNMIQWMLNCGLDVPKLAALAPAWTAAKTRVDEWGVAKQAGDIIVPHLDTFPTAVVQSERAGALTADPAMRAAAQAQAQALGVNWSNLATLAEKLLPLVLALLGKS